MRHRKWVLILLALLPGFAGCQGKETVTVSGAVERPGDYAFRSEWGVQEYVAASGGYLPEADVEEARLVRAQPDSTAEDGTDYLLISRWPLDRAPGVMPGDQIVVPPRTYAVFLDTVRSVKDVAIEWKERVSFDGRMRG